MKSHDGKRIDIMDELNIVFIDFQSSTCYNYFQGVLMVTNDNFFSSCLSATLYTMFGIQVSEEKSIVYLWLNLYGGYSSHLLWPVTMAMLVNQPTFDITDMVHATKFVFYILL